MAGETEPCTCRCERHGPFWSEQGDRSIARAHTRLQRAVYQLRRCLDPAVEAKANALADQAADLLDLLELQVRRARPRPARRPRVVRRLNPADTVPAAERTETT
ncbi:hypothetical protein ACL02T_12665 [Pseudonocardia sp. RS010]|uniref:hypothetical protein n=1 Tax=Pseudonocardia sp. RS010 TaxID=3385979 RepID=UPI0039A15782